MSLFTKIRDKVTQAADPRTAKDALANAAGKYLPNIKGFDKNAKSAIEHPLSFATGGLLGGKGGTFEVPHFSGGSMTNALSGSDQYGHSANKNRAIAAIIGTVLGGEALFGGDGAGAGTAGSSITDPVVEAGVDAGGTGTVAAQAIPEVGGAGSALGSVGSFIGNNWKSIVPMVSSLASMGKGSNLTPAQNQQQGIANTQQQEGQNLVNQYNLGQLNAADQYNIAQWDEQQTKASNAYYEKAGLGDSSMAQQAAAGIHARSSAMRQQALQNYLQAGMAYLGQAAGTLSPIISQQIAADQQAQQAQADFFKALAAMTTS